ncbi:hypothetical protein FRC09_005804, partial [Ceratobasidium sp. 395]
MSLPNLNTHTQPASVLPIADTGHSSLVVELGNNASSSSALQPLVDNARHTGSDGYCSSTEGSLRPTSDAQQPEFTVTPATDVDALATKFGLSQHDRATLLEFNQSNESLQKNLYFSAVLAQAHRIGGIEEMCAHLYVHYKHLGALMQEDWKPTNSHK